MAPKGVTKGASPSAKDENDEAVATTPVTSSAATSGSNDDRAPSAQLPKPNGDSDGKDTAKKKPSALDLLRAEKVSGEATTPTEDDDDGDEPRGIDSLADGEEAKPEADADGEGEAPKPDATAEATPEDGNAEEPKEESPFKGFTPEERNNLGRKASKRIVELNTKAKDLDRRIQELEPIRGDGEFVSRFRRENDLDETDVTTALELQAAYKRGDPKVLIALEESARQFREDLGMPALSAEAAIEPFKGALAQHYLDMKEVIGLSEEQVRLYAAFDARMAAAKDKPATPPAQPRVQPKPTTPATTPAHVDRATGFDRTELAAAGENVVTFLESEGIERLKAKDHVTKNLWPFLVKYAPIDPRTNQRDPRLTPPEKRLKAAEIAQQAWKLDVARKRAAAKQSNPAPLNESGGAPHADARGGNNGTGEQGTSLSKLRRSMVRT